VSPSAPPLPAPGIGIPNFQKVITALVAAATALVVLGNATGGSSANSAATGAGGSKARR